MRRLPIYFLIDVSESMIGEPITQVENGMRNIIQELRTDPYALETVFVSVIAFAGKAKHLIPLTELYKFYPPKFPIGGGTSLGTAMDFLMNDIEKNVVKTTAEMKGDWKPIIFLFTDGTPTDDPSAAIDRWQRQYKSKANLVCISLGDNADTKILSKLTENVLRLKDTDEQSFKAFFKWVTASIKSSSVSVTDTGIDDLQLAPIDGISLEKVPENENCIIDENFAVVLGKCQTTGKTYLAKFAKRSSYFSYMGIVNPEILVNKFKLVGAYPVDEEQYNSLSVGKSNRNINTNELIGSPTCPCCGNQFGIVVCECGNVFCVGENPHNKCPWCGMEGTLGEIDRTGANIKRGRG